LVRIWLGLGCSGSRSGFGIFSIYGLLWRPLLRIFWLLQFWIWVICARIRGYI
jgi:hypothetical protein